jgi:hypothetical protein
VGATRRPYPAFEASEASGTPTQRDVRAKRAERRANAYIKGANNDAQRTARQERQMARRAWKRRRRGLYIVRYTEQQRKKAIEATAPIIYPTHLSIVHAYPPQTVDASPPRRVDASPPQSRCLSAAESMPLRRRVDASPPYRVDASPPQTVDASPPHRVDASLPQSRRLHRIESMPLHRRVDASPPRSRCLSAAESMPLRHKRSMPLPRVEWMPLYRRVDASTA